MMQLLKSWQPKLEWDSWQVLVAGVLFEALATAFDLATTFFALHYFPKSLMENTAFFLDPQTGEFLLARTLVYRTIWLMAFAGEGLLLYALTGRWWTSAIPSVYWGVRTWGAAVNNIAWIILVWLGL